MLKRGANIVPKGLTPFSMSYWLLLYKITRFLYKTLYAIRSSYFPILLGLKVPKCVANIVPKMSYSSSSVPVVYFFFSLQ